MIRHRAGAVGSVKAGRATVEEIDKMELVCKNMVKRRRLNYVLGAVLFVFLCYLQIGLLFLFDLTKLSFHKEKKSSQRPNLRKVNKTESVLDSIEIDAGQIRDADANITGENGTQTDLIADMGELSSALGKKSR